MAETLIRPVCPGDAPVLAHIQTESWRAAFSAILTPEELERFTDFGHVLRMQERLLAEGIGHGLLLTADGAPHCMAFWDKAREDLPGYAELICIHSLQTGWGRGYGSRMMERLLAEMRAAGYESVLLWVFEENTRARRFYERHGFADTGRRKPFGSAVEMMMDRAL